MNADNLQEVRRRSASASQLSKQTSPRHKCILPQFPYARPLANRKKHTRRNNVARDT